MSPSDLFLIACGVCVLGCLLLVGAGVARRSAALTWWGGGYALGGLGMGAVAAADLFSSGWFATIGSGLVLCAYSLLWIGVGALSRPRATRYWVIPLGLIWALIAQIPALSDNETARMITFGPLVAFVMLGLAWDAYHLPGRPPARLPLVALAALHIAFSLLRSGALVLDPAAHDAWLYATPVEGIFYLFCDAFLVINLVRSVQEHALAEEAYTDFLTGVLSRRRFAQLAKTALAQGPCTLLMLDVDYFKQVNDTFGHAAGDAALRALGDIFRQEVPRTALVGRLGGDEFAILLTGTGEDGQVIAGRVAGAFARECRAKGWPSSVSIGLARKTDDDTTFDALIGQADSQLYGAKARRPSLNERASRRAS